jgi:hypothetical protein
MEFCWYGEHHVDLHLGWALLLLIFTLIQGDTNLPLAAAVTTIAVLFPGQPFFMPSLLHLGHWPYLVTPEIPLFFFPLLSQLSLTHPMPLCLGNTPRAPPWSWPFAGSITLSFFKISAWCNSANPVWVIQPLLPLISDMI